MDRYSIASDLAAWDLGARAVSANTSAPKVALGLDPNMGQRLVPGDPVANYPVAPVGALVQGERVKFYVGSFDSGGGVKEVEVETLDGELLYSASGWFGPRTESFYVDVPVAQGLDRLELRASATDWAGRKTSETYTYVVVENAPPEIEYNRFATDRTAQGYYQKIIENKARLDQGEFWVPFNGEWQIGADVLEDSGLASFELFELNAVGEPLTPPVYAKTYPLDCPSERQRQDRIFVQPYEQPPLRMTSSTSKRYMMRATDEQGQTSERTFFVHPVQNIAPEVRFVSPIANQNIVAGTPNLVMEVMVVDDRPIDWTSLTVSIDGVELAPPLPGTRIDTEDSLAARHTQLTSIYTSLKEKYGESVAKRLATETSQTYGTRYYLFDIPPSLTSPCGPRPEDLAGSCAPSMEFVVTLEDASGALGRHDIELVSVADNILPEGSLLAPDLGSTHYERTPVLFEFKAFDNVVVSEIEISTSYEATHNGATYETPWVSGRKVRGIPNTDAEPVSEQNIDTPRYTYAIQLPKLDDLASLPEFASFTATAQTIFEVRARLKITDGAGNVRQFDRSFAILPDLAPIVDILSPENGAKVVEQSTVSVNVNAFDDVGLDSVRMTVWRDGVANPIKRLTLTQAPWQFAFDVPAHDAAGGMRWDIEGELPRRLSQRQALDGVGHAITPHRH
ncbi:MAG: Ig-like domain-containing protein, partial [Myxococcota bacterium]